MNSAVIVNDIIGYFFQTSVEVRQGCLLKPTIFNIFFEKIIEYTLNNHTSTIDVG